ncbi:hypothetical protein EV668_0815 [Enterovirga rhinocerotis]|uniref:Uncharacterized protein n=2 Tax=Enterovirga rhinocerotis TaxID=1339210 RepID=A0A4R7C4S6_9HYPH|nr:hypothetical protein EV668_0815 [Enterovirga rhinocerotis]
MILALIGLLGIFVLVAMVVAPSQPVVRDWYLTHACGHLDRISTDICAAMRRAAGGRPI